MLELSVERGAYISVVPGCGASGLPWLLGPAIAVETCDVEAKRMRCGPALRRRLDLNSNRGWAGPKKKKKRQREKKRASL